MLPPNSAIDQAKEFGLKAVDYEIVDVSDVEQYMSKVDVQCRLLETGIRIIFHSNILTL
jgi:GH25 family lysozyme M1 (1,4-beta-N-acetylmuramidase)